MIERSMRQQSDYYSYYGCVTCGHELTRHENMYSFHCDWCGVEAVTPCWLQPKLVDGKIVVEKAEWSYVDLSGS